ncbi:tRNA (adenosine(37)-N6)-dimethylallyltransferase MiaA [Zunongwangia sp. HGR-M22]|uniref:tRNA (adenosine(37)-N6)-dimethylallyltransferase MiaA n=1 Tax=Zunongwangia sp. HGR-M22 TaxID=3015168 RepID=UPI0022DDB02E|nr:tRNA (adenosine(37)-N6)-dimethylallyltransferase MiaA [Zunongwangia sp. HGR-M22]WBL24951.1 tRNA (adenosine(37)-N6)-dimethylallyltransferase MiaA [Zunongwangia sp. HGR-M22]
MTDKILISVVGPTAIGKTALGIKIANYFDTEIISADSRQFFKEMNIGTAVPDPEELLAAKHHFIQHISIEDHYSVGDFEKEAISKISELFLDHDVVVLVGGSGLYVKSIIEGLDDFPDINPEIRKELNEILNNEGLKPLQKKLKHLDPEYFANADIENPHRIIRALEICMGTGKKFSSFRSQKKSQRDFKTIEIGLKADRQIIYDRINKRVDLMMQAGLLEEAKNLYPKKHLNALNTVGYKELFSYIDNEIALDFAISEIKKNTRHFAKRQLTWFRKNDNIHWFDYQTKPEKINAFISEELKKLQ